MEKIRKMGIDIIGAIPWGTHLCQFYRTRQDLLDILVPYFRAGLENNEFCMWVTSEPLIEKEAEKAMRAAVANFDQYLKSGQIEIIPYHQWYLKDGSFNLPGVLRGWIDKLDAALAKGYQGMRVTGNTAWLEKRDWKNFTDYEEAISSVIGGYQMIAICSYSLDKCGASKVIDVVRNHQFALIRQAGQWVVMESTARKHAEEAHRQSESKYRLLFERSNDAIFLVDTVTGRYLDANTAAARLTGRSVSEIKTLTTHDITPVASADRLQKVVSTQDPLDFGEVTYYRPDGSQRTALLSSVPLGNEVAFGIARDITGRKKAEEDIRKFKTIADNAGYGVTVGTPEGEIIYANKALARMHGYTPKELIGKHFCLLYPDKQAIIVEKLRNRILIEGGHWVEEIWRKRKDGTIFPSLMTITVIMDDNGKPLYAASTAIDITEHKRAEEKLKGSEERYRALLNPYTWTGEAVILLENTEKGKAIHTFVSNEWPRITGYSEAELLGMSWFNLVHPRFRRVATERYQKRLAGETVPGLFELSILRKDGAEVLIEATGGNTSYQASHANVVYIRDITERKKMEEQLKQSQLLASLGEMTAGIAHEVGNPLGSVLLYSELMIASDIPAQARKDLNVIHSEAKRATKVMTDLLAYGRRVKPQMRRLDLHKILKRVLKMRRYRQKVQNITAFICLHADPLYVKGDSAQLMQVFMNLILNAEEAIKQADGGNIAITTKVDGEWAKVSIADNGAGIPQKNLSHVFYPFFTTKSVGQGTGLGLSMCYGIVAGHNGLIRAENNDMGGATFTVELPLAEFKKRAATKRLNMLVTPE